MIEQGLIGKASRYKNNEQTSNLYQVYILDTEPCQRGVRETPPSVSVTPPPVSERHTEPNPIEPNPVNQDADAESRSFLSQLIEIVNPREKVTESRLRDLRGRLKEYGREEIVAAAVAFSKSEWHIDNKQMSIDNLLRPSKFGRWYAQSQEPDRKKFV